MPSGVVLVSATALSSSRGSTKPGMTVNAAPGVGAGRLRSLREQRIFQDGGAEPEAPAWPVRIDHEITDLVCRHSFNGLKSKHWRAALA